MKIYQHNKLNPSKCRDTREEENRQSGKTRGIYSSECQGNRHLKTQLLAPDSSQQQDTHHGWLGELKRKIKSPTSRAKAWPAAAREPPHFLSAQSLLVRNDQFCLAKRHQDIEEMLCIKFCRISLLEMHWSQHQNQYVFHGSLVEAFSGRDTETPSLSL